MEQTAQKPEYEDIVLGGDDREPEDDFTGVVNATFIGLAIVDKPEWKLLLEQQRGKENIDTKQFRWDFRVEEGPMDQQTHSLFTNRSWGDRANATAVAIALTGQKPSRSNGISTSQVVGCPCRLQFIYREEKGRNYIEKVHPPRKASTGQQTASTPRTQEVLDSAVELMTGEKLPLV